MAEADEWHRSLHNRKPFSVVTEHFRSRRLWKIHSLQKVSSWQAFIQCQKASRRSTSMMHQSGEFHMKMCRKIVVRLQRMQKLTGSWTSQSPFSNLRALDGFRIRCQFVSTSFLKKGFVWMSCSLFPQSVMQSGQS